MKFTNLITGQQVTAKDWQLALKPGDYYLIKSPYVGDQNYTGPTIYGEIITNTPEEGEPPYEEGFFLVRGYSQWCPDGELGMFSIVDATRQITKEEFELARQQGWPKEIDHE
ncbi:MAG: hypothetical protein KDJ65_01490 [Anaerolineae bacterium]|nr:hypothetical protein [Anaerolineae bacterium]